MEFGFDGNRFVTPMLMMWHPETRKLAKELIVHFEYSGNKIIRVTHRLLYLPASAVPAKVDRVSLTMTCIWEEHSSLDASSGIATLLGATFLMLVWLAFFICLDEAWRSHLFGDHTTHAPLTSMKAD